VAPRRRHRAECRRTRRTLQAYLDVEVDADTAWRVSRHLSRCEDCFADADVIRTLKDLLANLRTPPDPAVHRRLRKIVAMLADPQTRP